MEYLDSALLIFLIAAIMETRIRVEKVYRHICPHKKDLNTSSGKDKP